MLCVAIKAKHVFAHYNITFWTILEGFFFDVFMFRSQTVQIHAGLINNRQIKESGKKTEQNPPAFIQLGALHYWQP